MGLIADGRRGVGDPAVGAATGGRPPGRRRRRFSLNALAIQLSAFALSFTLVALLVVAGSQAAFVEESEAVSNYVPIGAPAESPQAPRRAPRPPAPVPPGTVPAPPPQPPAEPAVEPAEQPAEEPEVPDAAIELTDSDAGSAMFTDGTTLAPGHPLDRCIEVRYEGNDDPGPVRLYAATVAGDLAPYLDLTIEVGEGDPRSFGGCDGFVASESLYTGDLAAFAAAHAGYATGLATWDPEGELDVRSFRFRVAVRDEPDAEGRSVAFGFAWESRVG